MRYIMFFISRYVERIVGTVFKIDVYCILLEQFLGAFANFAKSDY
jgi:hypothetical protein